MEEGCVSAQSLSRVHLFVTPWTVAHQAPLSMGLSQQEYWSGLSFPPSRDLPNPGIKLTPPALAGKFFTTGPPGTKDSFKKNGTGTLYIHIKKKKYGPWPTLHILCKIN